ncbi:MED14-domain-containing protein [Hypomontagnella monticulosa]|nr:MED14-domain-containing protein [Hypomontagnella monticulosa]
MMPGVVMMENGVRAPLPTNHDRDNSQFVNGNGAQSAPDRQNGAGAGSGNAMANGKGNVDGANPAQSQQPGSNASRMNDLPDEIKHITDGYVPLGVLLSRLAQKTHNQLSDEILTLAKMPVPATAVNGNSSHAGAAADDSSPENLGKKAKLLNFVQEKHAEWVKMAVIARWSRNAQSVSKLIDLMFLIRMQEKRYTDITASMADHRWSLTFARLPNPDLRTALQVLSTGTAPWMPDFNYIEPPSLTPKDELQWVENLNTLLSIRLNLEDYDNIPYHFRDYTIEAGRVTFKVPGEFEVDLTIADEDFEKQFWFIDFRFDFSPAPTELSYALRLHLENKVNEVLEKDGLSGCYKFLHEMVLTHKIGEYVRQAFELRKERWVDTLKVERLNRAMSIQYWVGRHPPEGPKSWIILGVNSGRKLDGSEDHKSTSHLTLRWFRDNKEVKDAKISLEDADISTEDLLNRVIGRHVQYILGSIYSKLKLNGRFIKREAGLALDIREDDPIQSTLQMQLGHACYVTLGVSSTTGMFSIKPQLGMTWRWEQQLNWGSKDPVQDGLACLEGIRCGYFVDEIKRRGRSTGWTVSKGPVKLDAVKAALKSRDVGSLMWLKRRGWTERWYLMVSLSLGGDTWCLVEVNEAKTKISSFAKLPLSSYAPSLGDRFFTNLTIFTAAMISHITDMRTLHQRRIKHITHEGINYSLPASMKVPSIFIRLSDILKQPDLGGSNKRTAFWARDFVEVMFRGTRNAPAGPQISSGDLSATDAARDDNALQKGSLHSFLDARIKVSDPSRFGLLKGHVERDVAYSRRLGVFALRLETGVGTTILDTLAHRVQAIDKLADCINAIRRSDRDIQCEEITLSKVVVTYTDRTKPKDDMTAQPQVNRWKATLELGPNGIRVLFERGNPQLRALDHFRRLVNSDLRCEKLPFYLSSTLPLHRALDSVEDAWGDLSLNNQGRVEVVSVFLDWFNVRYYLPGSGRSPQVQRRLTLIIRLQRRKDDVEWVIYRKEPGSVGNPNDEFRQALDKVWNAEGRVWHSLVTSAASKTDRIGELIKAVDEAVRRLAAQSPSMLKQSQIKSQVQAKTSAQAVYHKTMAATKARPQANQVVEIIDD